MYEITTNIVLHRISALYHLFGIWENDKDSDLRKVAKKLFHIICELSFCVAFATGAYFNDNKNERIFIAALTAVHIVVFVRLTFMITKKKEFLAFLDDIGVHSFKDHQEFIEMKRKLKNFEYVSYFLILILIVGASFPFISCLPTFSSEKRLPFYIEFPLNWRNSEIAYWIAIIYVECPTVITALSLLNNLQLWYLMINYSLKYQMLGNKFKSLGVETKIENVKKSENQYLGVATTTAVKTVQRLQKQNFFLQDLIKLIKSHEHLQETVDRFRGCFSYLFFTQITTSAIGICASIYMLVFRSDETALIETLVFCIAAIYSLLDIFMLMYYGNEIKWSSNQLSYCLFQSNWMDQSETCKKCIIILTEVLQQPQQLVIFKLYPLDLEKFARILNLTYSMFNILQNFN